MKLTFRRDVDLSDIHQYIELVDDGYDQPRATNHLVRYGSRLGGKIAGWISKEEIAAYIFQHEGRE